MKVVTRETSIVPERCLKPLTWDDIQVGDEMDRLSYRETDERMHDLALYYYDFFSWHISDIVGEKSSFKKKVAQGLCAEQFIQQGVVNWLGSPGALLYGGSQDTKLTYPVYVGDTITFGGKVADKKVEDGIRYVYCDVWERNQDDNLAVAGTVRLCFGYES